MENRVYAFNTEDGDIVLTTSDDRGLKEGYTPKTGTVKLEGVSASNDP